MPGEQQEYWRSCIKCRREGGWSECHGIQGFCLCRNDKWIRGFRTVCTKIKIGKGRYRNVFKGTV